MSTAELRGSFRPARRTDLDSIVDVRRRVLGDFLTWDDPGYLQWRYDFDGSQDARGKCLVVARGNRVLGMIGAEFIRLAANKEVVEALSLMDIMVDPELDGSGLGIWLNMAVFADHPVVIEIGANPNSIGLITKLFDRMPDRRDYIAPVTLHRYLNDRLGNRSLARFVAVPADALLALLRRVAARRTPAIWDLHPLTRFDASVERLFARRWAASDVTYERTSDYLNWRLFSNPRAKCSVMGAFSNGELVGYSAFQVRDRPDGLRFVSLVDWLVDERFGLVGAMELFQQTIALAARDGADFVSVTHLHSRTQGRLWRLGFVGLPAPFNTVGLHCSATAVLPQLDQSPWFLTEANTDRDGLT